MKYLPTAPVGTVVHVNAQDSVVFDWAICCDAKQLLVVSGSGEMTSLLRHYSRGRPNVEIIDHAVAAGNKVAHWRNFNVSEVDGPLQPAALRNIFPRLHVLSERAVEPVDLSAILSRFPNRLPHDLPNVLVLEMPGLELSILEALPQEQLRFFDWIMLRCAAEGLYEDASSPEAVASFMSDRFYPIVACDGEIDPYWPSFLFFFDKESADRRAAAMMLEHLQQKLEQLEAEARAAAEAYEQQEMLAEERLVEIRALEAVRDAAGEQAKQRLIESDEATRARDLATQLARDRLEQLERVKRALDEQQGLADENARQMKSLARTLTSVEALAQERLVEVEELKRARADQARLVSGIQKRLTELEVDNVKLVARDSLLQEELLKAEAHVELISDLLFREPLR